MIEKVCKDCYPDEKVRASVRTYGYAWIDGKKVRPRPAKHQGPRCVSHWRDEVKRTKAVNHEKRVQETYGLKEGEYARLHIYQGGLCALCRRATGSSRRLSVDHDHATGEVRGLLCRPCNTLLGHARDKLAFFRRCISYLTFPPCRAMRDGWTDWYADE